MPRFEQYQPQDPATFWLPETMPAYGMWTEYSELMSVLWSSEAHTGSAIEVDIVPTDLSLPRSQVVATLRGQLMNDTYGAVAVHDSPALDGLEGQIIILATRSCFPNRLGPELDTKLSRVAPNRLAMYLDPTTIPYGMPMRGEAKQRAFRSLGGRYGRVIIGGAILFDIRAGGYKKVKSSEAYAQN